MTSSNLHALGWGQSLDFLVLNYERKSQLH